MMAAIRSQVPAIYLTGRMVTSTDDLQIRAYRRAVSLLCEWMLDVIEGPVKDLDEQVQRLADEVAALERELSLNKKNRRVYGKRKASMHRENGRLL